MTDQEHAAKIIELAGKLNDAVMVAARYDLRIVISVIEITSIEKRWPRPVLDVSVLREVNV